MKNRIFRVLLLLLLAAVTSHAQVLTQAEYFVDADPGVGLATPISVTPGDTVISSFSIPLDGLSPGFHWVYVRTRDIQGRWGIAMPTKFYIFSPQPDPAILPRYFPVTKAEYFFDTDPGEGMGFPLPLIRGDTVDANRYLRIVGLDTGYHYLYIRAMDQMNLWGLAKRIRFHVDTAICDYPLADFTYDTVTYGTPCHFTNLSQDTALTGTTYEWEIYGNDTAIYNTRNVVHTFTSPGYYSAKLTVTNDSACSASIIRDVITGPLPDTTFLIAGSTSLCAGDSVILTSNNYEEGTIFDWSTGETSRAITVKRSGYYYCWVTNSYGISLKSVTVSVEVHAIPQVTLTTFDATGGGSNGSAWVDITGGEGSYTINWSNLATGPVVNGLAPGNYMVTVTDGNCPVVKSFSIVNIPVVPGNITAAEYFFDTDPGQGNGTPINIWAGDTIDYKFSLPVTGLGEGFHHLYIRTKDTREIWGIATRHKIFVDPNGSIPPPPEQPPITQAEYFINTDPGMGKGVNIPVPTDDQLTVDFQLPTAGLAPGFYRLYIRTKDMDGKWGHHANTLFYVYDSVWHDLTKRQKSIAGAEYFYDTDPGAGNGSVIKSNIYDAIDLTRDIRIGNLTPGLHRVYLRAFDERGIRGLWQRAEFTVLNVACTCPTVDFDVDTVNVLGDPTHFTDISSGTVPGATYEWDVNGDGVIDYNVPAFTHVYPQYGLYNARLTVRNSTDCYASMTRQVVVSPKVDTALTIIGNTTFCDGESVTIVAQPGYQYNWNTDETTQSITVTQSGDYSVRLTNIYGVQGFSRTIHVTVYPVPTVNIVTINANVGQANGTAICNVTGGTGNYTHLWSNGNTFSIVNNLAAGIYSVTVSDGRCPVIREFTIGEDPVSPGDVVKAEYFFDTDPGVGNATPLNIAGGDSVYFATLIPVTGLLPGYHHIYIRAADTYNRWGIIKWEKFIVYELIPNILVDQPPIVKAEYFYDQDPGVGNGMEIPLTSGDVIDHNFTAVTTGLPPGFHKLSIRALDSLGRWGLTRTQEMYVYEDSAVNLIKDQPKLVAAEYFFDTDPGVGLGKSLSFSPTGDLIDLFRYLPVTGLTAGTHRAYIRVKDEAGVWSIYAGVAFNVFNTLCTMPSVNFTKVATNAGQLVTYTNTSGNLLPTSTYEWDIGNDGSVEYTTKDFTHTFALSGNYNLKLTVYNSDTCKASVLKEVYVGPLPPATITVNGNTSFCDGDSVQLSVSPGYIYEWWPTGETTQSIWVKNSGTYYCWLSTLTGLEVKSQVKVVTRYQIPTVTLHTIDASGGNANGSAWVDVTGGSGNYTYAWSSGATTFYANNLAPGSYTVQVNDGHCPVVQSFVIGTHPVVAGNILAAEYFFDTDPGVGLGIPLNISAADTAEYVTGCDASGLSVGYHHVYIRAMDTYNRWSIYKWEKFYVYPLQLALPQASQPLTSGEYFIDLDPVNRPDPGVGLGTPITFPPAVQVDVNYSFSVDTLVVGFHHLATRVRDSIGEWSLIHPTVFYLYDTTRKDVRKDQPPLVAAEYFIDTDPGVGQGIAMGVTPGETIDWSGGVPMGLTQPGIHYLYVRAKDSIGQWSIYRWAAFEVVNCTQPTANFTFSPTCIDNAVVFNDISSNVDPAATYDWDFNNDGIVDDHTHGTVSHLYTVPGIYQCKLKITHNVACRDSIIQTVIFPYVHLPNDTTIYTDQSIVLDGGAGYSSYLWSTGATTQTYTVNGATAGIGVHHITVTVTNSNLCSATDAIDVTITLPPRDLIVETASITPNTIPANGDSADLRCVIRNTGTISAVASVVNYYLSADATLSIDDQLLGFGIVNTLPAGGSENIFNRVFIPPGIEGQMWYILFYADGSQLVVENNEGNNMTPVNFFYGPVYIPVNLSVSNLTIANGQVRCFNAQQTITVAGTGSAFHVQSGGRATFIAGLKIRFLPGVRVFSGGYLRGYISTNGQYCYVVPPVSIPAGDTNNIKWATAVLGTGPPPGTSYCYLYPNPTNGEFSLAISSGNRQWPVTVQIYNALSTMVQEIKLDQGGVHHMSLQNQAPGIYFLHVKDGTNAEILKVIRY